ncbi:hypothetical protein KEM48_010325 [Puccinia striiformis f. sp. tritici PST-130]|nr:hypothetical protein KEM48_010325 [Puccinia striiformis f. sp. tritici PST-130]
MAKEFLLFGLIPGFVLRLGLICYSVYHDTLILTPNEFIHPCWGKALFGITDLVIGILLYQLCPSRGTLSSHRQLVTLIWLLNPFVMNISTRGSSESLLGVVIIGFLYSAQRKKWDTAAILLGVARTFQTLPVHLCYRYLGPTHLTAFSALNLLMYSIWGHEFLDQATSTLA